MTPRNAIALVLVGCGAPEAPTPPAPEDPAPAVAPARGPETGFHAEPLLYGRSSYPARKITVEDGDRRVTLDWACWLVTVGDLRVLVDTGVDDPAIGARWGMTGFRRPVDLLADRGIAPEDIDWVVVTHHHFDHIGSAHRFPRARIAIQRAEYDRFRTTDRFGKVRSFFEAAADRLVLVDGDAELFTGVSVVVSGGHTAGSQAVIVDAPDGTRHVFPGDECYQAPLCRTASPLPAAVAVNPAANVAFLAKLQTWLADGAEVHPLHDITP